MSTQGQPTLDVIRSRRLSDISLKDMSALADAGDIEWARIEQDFHPSQRHLLRRLLDEGAVSTSCLIQYVQQRASLDALVEDCDRVHVRIASEGALPELVELYAQARDRYEDAVEMLGGFGQAVQAALDTLSTPRQ